MKEEMTGYPSIDKPWLKFYNVLPEKLEVPDCSIYEYMHECSHMYMELYAIEYMGIKITYQEMYSKIDIATRALMALGVKSGDIVSVCLPNIPEVVYIFYAINRLGATANMLDLRSSESDLRTEIEEAKSRHIFTLDSVVGKLGKIVSDSNFTIVYVSTIESFTKIKKKLAYCFKPALRTRVTKKDNIYSYSDFVNKGNGYTASIVETYDADAIAVIAYTGGTTGIPKGVMVTNRCMNAPVVSNSATGYNTKPGDRAICVAPPWTYYGLSNSLNTYFSMGLQVVMIPQLDANDWGKLIHNSKPNHIITVPSALRNIMSSKLLEKEKMTYLKSIIVGADKLDETLEIEFNTFLYEHNCETVVTKGYGMTEVVAGATYTKSNSNIIGSVGIPYILNTVSMFETIDDEIVECPLGQSGEIAITGPTVMSGYFGKDKILDSNVLRVHNDGVVWAHTGDIGHMDEDGRIYVDGRIKRMFTRDGYKIFPSVIESVINKHPAINMSAVIAVSDDINGSAIKAFLVLKSGIVVASKSVIWNEILETCLEELYEYQIPECYEFIDKLPLTGMGKIDYASLEEM